MEWYIKIKVRAIMILTQLAYHALALNCDARRISRRPLPTWEILQANFNSRLGRFMLQVFESFCVKSRLCMFQI